MRIVTVIAAGLAAVGAMISLSNTAQAQVVIRCAREGQACYVPPSTRILYGRDGATVIKTLNGQTIDCTDAAFGHDPLVGIGKIWHLIVPSSRPQHLDALRFEHNVQWRLRRGHDRSLRRPGFPNMGLPQFHHHVGLLRPGPLWRRSEARRIEEMRVAPLRGSSAG